MAKSLLRHSMEKNFMSENTQPFWYRLIVSEKDKGLIDNGLTIPYIIGAKSLADDSYNVNTESVRLLLDEIVGSSTEKTAFLMFCNDRLEEFVIALMEKNEAKEMSENRISFYNSDTGEKTFFISLNAENRGLGTEIEEISANLNSRYLKFLKESRFSRQGKTNWKEFDVEQVKRIKAL
jgi:hypothetical protein